MRVCVCQEPTAALIANPLLPFNPANPKLQTVCRLFSSGLKKAGSYPEGSLKICWKKKSPSSWFLHCAAWHLFITVMDGEVHLTLLLAITLFTGRRKKSRIITETGTVTNFHICRWHCYTWRRASWSCGHSNKLKALEVVGRNKHEKAREELLRKQILHLLLLHQRETEGGSRRTECTC